MLVQVNDFEILINSAVIVPCMPETYAWHICRSWTAVSQPQHMCACRAKSVCALQFMLYILFFHSKIAGLFEGDTQRWAIDGAHS